MGEHAEARRFFQRSLDRGRETGERVKIAWSLTNLGDTIALRGDYAQAESNWREANHLFRQTETPVGITGTNIPMGSVALFRGELETVRALAKETLEIAREINSTTSRRNALIRLGWVALVEKDYSTAGKSLQEALSTRPSSFEANLGLAFVAYGLDDLPEARSHLGTALNYATVDRPPAMTILALPAAALIAAHEGEIERAAEWLSLAFHHPLGPTGLLVTWSLVVQLRAKLETSVAPAVFEAAWERGLTLEFEDVLASL
jgi:tetratricopeptide (TPR) repeat protein